VYLKCNEKETNNSLKVEIISTRNENSIKTSVFKIAPVKTITKMFTTKIQM
jgi:hypothetical protein